MDLLFQLRQAHSEELAKAEAHLQIYMLPVDVIISAHGYIQY